MPLPSPKRLRAGRQMQVESSEITFAGASEILCRERIYAFPTLYAATTKDLLAGATPHRWAFFSSLLESRLPGNDQVVNL